MRTFYICTEDFIDNQLLSDITSSLKKHGFLPQVIEFSYKNINQYFYNGVGYIDYVYSNDNSIKLEFPQVKMIGSAVDILVYEKEENYKIEKLTNEEPIIAYEHARTTLVQSGNTSIAQRVPKHMTIKKKYPNLILEYITDEQEIILKNGKLKVKVENTIKNLSKGLEIQLKSVKTVGIQYHDNLKGMNNIQIYSNIFEFEKDLSMRSKKVAILFNFDHSTKVITINIRLDKSKNEGKPVNDPNIGFLVMTNELVKFFNNDYRIVVNDHGLTKISLKDCKLAKYINDNNIVLNY